MTVKSDADLFSLVRILKNKSDKPTARHEAANILRNSGYCNLTNDLLDVLVDSSDMSVFRSWAIQHLFINLNEKYDPENAKTIETNLIKYLDDPDLSVKREAILSLVKINNQEGINRVMYSLDNNCEDTLSLAIRCALILNMQEYKSKIRTYLTNHNESIQISAIVALGKWKDELARPVIESMCSSNNVRVSNAAKKALLN
jgi:HEAT repeat protein